MVQGHRVVPYTGEQQIVVCTKDWDMRLDRGAQTLAKLEQTKAVRDTRACQMHSDVMHFPYLWFMRNAWKYYSLVISRVN
jgi:hypothetical protein